MNIFITGGSGFVGSHLAKRLNGKHEVTIGGLNPEETAIELPEDVDREKVNVTDPTTLDFEGYDCVIHLVALSPLKKPPVPYREVHVEGTRKVVDQAEEDGVEKYFHMSALGASKDANTEYLRTKAEAENYVEKSELNYRIFKPSVIFGEGGHFFDFISGLTTPFVTVLPGKNTLFQPINVEDMAEMIEESLLEKYDNRKFELGGPEKISLGELTGKVYRSRGSSVHVIGLPSPLFGLAMAVSDHVSFSPFGLEQYRSLKTDNVALHNQVSELGMNEEGMKTVDEYLGL